MWLTKRDCTLVTARHWLYVDLQDRENEFQGGQVLDLVLDVVSHVESRVKLCTGDAYAYAIVLKNFSRQVRVAHMYRALGAD